tara:strand:+ start:1155 stop:1706 length:552 start_codon:yes stop_codon:yes gene_type:complete
MRRKIMNEFVKVPNTTLPFREWVINYLNKTSIEKYDTKPSKEQMEMIKSLWEATMEEDVRRNDTYTVYIDWDSAEHGGMTPNEKMKVVHLSIKRLDRDIIVDYREFMDIKDQLVGDEYEAVMLFPARDREHDTVNQYHLWIPMEKVDDIPVKIPFGWDNGRHIWDEEQALKAGAKQRPFKEQA